MPAETTMKRCGLKSAYETTTNEKFLRMFHGQGALFINILKKLAKKTSIGDDTPKERHLADREWVGGSHPPF